MRDDHAYQIDEPLPGAVPASWSARAVSLLQLVTAVPAAKGPKPGHQRLGRFVKGPRQTFRLIRIGSILTVLAVALLPLYSAGDRWVVLILAASVAWYAAKRAVRPRLRRLTTWPTAKHLGIVLEAVIPLIETLALTAVLVTLASTHHVDPLSLMSLTLLYFWPLYRANHLRSIWDGRTRLDEVLEPVILVIAALTLLGLAILGGATALQWLMPAAVWLIALFGVRLDFHQQVTERESLRRLDRLSTSRSERDSLEKLAEETLFNPGANVVVVYPQDIEAVSMPIIQVRDIDLDVDTPHSLILSSLKRLIRHWKQHGDRCLFIQHGVHHPGAQSITRRSIVSTPEITTSVGIVLAPHDDDPDYILAVLWMHFIYPRDEIQRAYIRDWAQQAARELERSLIAVAQAARREADIRLAEREKVISELHDDVRGRLTTAAQLMNHVVRVHYSTDPAAAQDTAANALQDIVEAEWCVQNALTHLRIIQSELSTQRLVMSPVDFASNLRKLTDIAARGLPASKPRPTVTFLGWEHLHQLPEGYLADGTLRQVVFYDVIAEAIRNSYRHSEASEIVVRLTKEDDAITVSIEDNGNGIPEAYRSADAGSIGLMKQLCADLEGAFTVISKPVFPGTKLICDCPVKVAGEEVRA